MVSFEILFIEIKFRTTVELKNLPFVSRSNEEKKDKY